MVIRHGLDPARSLMPAAIKRFNEAVGGVNTATSGYQRLPRNDHPELGDRKLPLGSYSEALL